MECDIIVYDITEDPDQIDEAVWAVSGKKWKYMKIFIGCLFWIIISLTYCLSKLYVSLGVFVIQNWLYVISLDFYDNCLISTIYLYRNSLWLGENREA